MTELRFLWEHRRESAVPPQPQCTLHHSAPSTSLPHCTLHHICSVHTTSTLQLQPNYFGLKTLVSAPLRYGASAIRLFNKRYLNMQDQKKILQTATCFSLSLLPCAGYELYSWSQLKGHVFSVSWRALSLILQQCMVTPVLQAVGRTGLILELKPLAKDRFGMLCKKCGEQIMLPETVIT